MMACVDLARVMGLGTFTSCLLISCYMYGCMVFVCVAFPRGVTLSAHSMCEFEHEIKDDNALARCICQANLRGGFLDMTA